MATTPIDRRRFLALTGGALGAVTVGQLVASTSDASAAGAGWDADVRLGLAANPHVKFYNGAYRGYVLCEVTPTAWRSHLRIVLNARDAASPAYTIAAFEVADGTAGARRIDTGDGLVGRVTDASSGAGLPNVEVAVIGSDGGRITATTTDPAGEYLVFVPPGTYQVAVNGVGYEPASGQAAVPAEGGVPVNLRLERASVWAGTGRTVPGPQSQATTGDVVLTNDLLAIAVSTVTADPQLPNASLGKPLDLAAVGHLDQLDWMNLPYASATQPRGGNAWQQLTVRSTSVEVVAAGGPEASVRVVGTSSAVPDLDVVTTYSVRQGEPWVTVATIFTNRGAVDQSFWLGDVIDHDGTGQRGGVPGHGTITDGTLADFVPTAPWIGMTGSDRQTYGLLYEDAEFTAYACGIWVQSQRQVTLVPQATYTLRRRVVAIDSGEAADPFAVLASL